MKELLRRLKLQPILTAEAGIASLFANILALASPLFVIQVLNRYVAHGVDATLVTLATGVVMAIVLEFAFRQVRMRLLRTVNARADATIAAAGFGVLVRAKAGALELIPPGKRRQIINATSSIERAFNASNIAAVFDVPFSLLFIGVLFLLSPALSGIVLVFLVATFVLGAAGGLSAQKNSRDLIRGSAAGNSLIATVTGQVETVRAFNAGGFLMTAWQEYTRATQAVRLLMERRQTLVQTLTQSGTALMSVVVVSVGATLVVSGSIDVGAMIGANILAARALMPISRFSQLGATFSEAAENMELLNEFSQIPLEMDGGSYKADYKGGLELSDVGFAHPGANTPLFESLSAVIRPGNILVICGGNGTGKTTLARLIVGLYEPTRGKVLADGLDLRQTSPAWWRAQVVYLPQEPTLLNASVRDNLLTANPDLDADGIGRVIGAVGLTNYMDESPRGLETMISDNGGNLSPGIRRRLALARALATDGMLVVLDEPTEGLDAEGIACVHAAIKDLARRGRSIIVISHDPKIVKGAHTAIDLNLKPVPRVTERPRAVEG
ncbi:MAG: ATP-binding cassette domain-containing protein [Alphaproteobacteria bacterium]